MLPRRLRGVFPAVLVAFTVSQWFEMVFRIVAVHYNGSLLSMASVARTWHSYSLLSESTYGGRWRKSERDGCVEILKDMAMNKRGYQVGSLCSIWRVPPKDACLPQTYSVPCCLEGTQHASRTVNRLIA